jgi:hypothetical protein
MENVGGFVSLWVGMSSVNLRIGGAQEIQSRILPFGGKFREDGYRIEYPKNERGGTARAEAGGGPSAV